MKRPPSFRRIYGRNLPIAVAVVIVALLLERVLDRPPGVPAPDGDGRSPCTVSRVADGDSIECAGGDRVRLLGIDAPELAQGRAGREALRHLERRAGAGSRVTLERDIRPRDRFGRTLAWVRDADGRLVNEAMVREGYAVAFLIGENRRYEAEVRAAEEAASRNRRGLWASGGFECRPVDFRHDRCR